MPGFLQTGIIMSKAIVIHEYGGPDVLKWEDVEVGDPGPDQVRIRHTAAGLNYRDIYHRNGNYGVPQFPAIIGGDGAGVIEAVGANVEGFEVGQRVAYGNGLMGSYSQARLFTTEHLLPLPEGVADDVAAAMLVKGFTSYALVRRAFPVKAGDTILIHAVAGGCGLIMCQMAKDLGATVIGTTSTEEKAELASSLGCDHVILYTKEDFAARVRELTDGEGVDAVIDGVGAATYMGSLDSLKHCGTLVGYGNASGNFPPVEPFDLMRRGSLFFTRVNTNFYYKGPEDIAQVGRELFDLVETDKVKIIINQTYPLEDAAQAHRDLEARKTSGSVVYIP